MECSALVVLTAELDLFTRALGILSGQPPSGRPPLTNSDPLITPLQERCRSLQTPPSRRGHLGLLAAPSPRVDRTSECFGTHHQCHSRRPNGPTTTTYSAHNHSRPNGRSASDTPISASCQPSSPGPGRPVQTADEAKTPFFSRLLRRTELQTSLPQLLHSVFASGPRAVHLRRGKNLLDPHLLQGRTCCEVVREPLLPGGGHWHFSNSILG